MTSSTLSAADDLSNGEFEYRPLNTGAIAAMAFGVLSLVVIFAGRTSPESSVALAPLPLVGIVFGLRALRQIRSNPDRYTGRRLAAAGVALSAICLVVGLGVARYTYATEVPEGYLRTSFEELRPDEADQRGDKLIPDDVMKLDGKKVFIKGYFRPGSSDYDRNATHFLLVRDSNTCCFGDLSSVQYFDRVSVNLTGKKTVDYSTSLFSMAGTLRVFPENVHRMDTAPVFVLEADYAQ